MRDSNRQGGEDRGAQNPSVRFQALIRGEDLLVGPKNVIPIGLAVQEFDHNSLKPANLHHPQHILSESRIGWGTVMVDSSRVRGARSARGFLPDLSQSNINQPGAPLSRLGSCRKTSGPIAGRYLWRLGSSRKLARRIGPEPGFGFVSQAYGVVSEAVPRSTNWVRLANPS
jgi:hypothetical protein